MEWIKANKAIAIGLGVGLFLLVIIIIYFLTRSGDGGPSANALLVGSIQ